MAIQDEIAQQMAAPTERAENADSPFTGMDTIAMPGSPQFEQYLQGNANNQASGVGAGIVEVNGVGIGDTSLDVGLMTDPMAGLLPNPIVPFPAVTPGYDVGQTDAMRGITTGSVQGSLLGDRMYIQGAGDFPVDSYTAGSPQPEIEGE